MLRVLGIVGVVAWAIVAIFLALNHVPIVVALLWPILLWITVKAWKMMASHGF